MLYYMHKKCTYYNTKYFIYLCKCPFHKRRAVSASVDNTLEKIPTFEENSRILLTIVHEPICMQDKL